MSITGNLKTMPFGELLQWLSQSQKTGTLVLDNAQIEKRVFFRHGTIISTASTDPREHLGHFLVSHGFIGEEQLSASVRRQEEDRALLGKILMAMNAISQTDLDRMLRLKAEESLYDVFGWREGGFRFLDGELPEYDMLPLAIDVTHLVLEAAHRTDEWQRIRQMIRSPQAIPVQIADSPDGDLEPGERLVWSRIDDQRTVEDLCLDTHSSEYYVCRVLFEQLQRGRLKVVHPRAGAPVPVAADGAVDAAALVRMGQELLQRKDWESALRHFRAARSLDPNNGRVRAAAQKGEERISAEVEKARIEPDTVPVLVRPMEALTRLPLSPAEAFILSRINGIYDVASVLKISPMSPLEVRLVFAKLVEAGHIELRRPRHRGA
jgi:hypothetical protein